MSYKQKSPQPVVEGGTEIQSATAYAPICGGTTSTSPLQSGDSGISNSGYVYTSNGASSLPSFQEVSVGGGTLGTVQDTTSGTSVSFTGIPSGVKYILFGLQNVSASDGSGTFALQLGDAGGVETTGYAGRTVLSGTQYTWTTAIRITQAAAIETSKTYVGTVELSLSNASSNTWVVSLNTTAVSASSCVYGSGIKSLSGELTQIMFSVETAGAFNGGSVNILYYS